MNILHENFNVEIDLFANNVLPLKRCGKCKDTKALTEFGKHKSRKDGLQGYCRQCSRNAIREAARKIRATPEGREKHRESSRKAYATPGGLEKHREAGRKFLATPEGRAKNRASSLAFHKNHPNGNYAKKANDPLYKLQSNIRSLISHSLKKTGHKKSSKTVEILGCSTEDFKFHLQAQFSNGMTLENHGALWELDHMVPQSWARTEQEAIALNHHTNFRPLLAAENIAKGNRLSACGLTKEQWYAANPIPLALNK
jgi:hypothetical protein